MKTSRARIFALLAVWIPATALAAGFARIMVSAPPLVTGLSPLQVTAGQTMVLRLRGRALRDGLAASLGAGVYAEAVSHASADGSQASLRIRVGANAAPGRRQLVLVQGGKRLPQNAYVSIRSKRVIAPLPKGIQIESGSGAPGMMVPAPSVLAVVTPQAVRAGSRLELKLEGSGFKPGLRVDYGPGVHIESLRVLGATRATATVRIDATVPPGRRLPRASEPQGKVRVEPLAALRIAGAPVKVYGIAPGGSKTPALIPPTVRLKPLAAAERLLGVTPNRLEAGKTYQVTAYGENLRAGLALDLGAGVSVAAVNVLDARRAEVSLKVDAGAAPGLRRVQIRAGASAAWSAQPATFVVQAPFHLARLPQPKLPAFAANTAIEGRILLKRPQWYSGLASKPAPKNPLTGKSSGPGTVIKVGVDVPTLKDDSLFVWREQNPGLAEWYEVRFYAGGKLIATRRIDKQLVAFVHKKMLPTWLVPDSDLVAALGRPHAPTRGRAARAGSGGFKVGGVAKGNYPGGAQANELPSSDLTWEVAGYRRYFKSGVEAHAALEQRRPILVASLSKTVPTSKQIGAMVAREVERSERWPLNAPYAPTGLGCGSEAPSGLDVTNEDRGVTSQGAVETADHTGERWKVTGTFDLGRSPWASHPQKLQSAGGHPKVIQSTSWRFDNVYVDWGDGTVVPLSLTQPGDAKDYKADRKLDFTSMLNASGFTHAYSATGSYTVRIYQLSESDIQSESAGNVSVAANPGGSLYAAARAAAGGRTGGSSGGAAPPGFRHAKATGDHAYMLMCKRVVISPRHDSDSDGPLNLVAAKLRGFPEQPGNDTPPKGVKVAQSGTQQFAGFKPATGAGARASRRSSHSSRASTRIARRSSGGAEPSFSTCDVSLAGGGYLYYYGQGKVRLTWTLDGESMGSRTLALGPSTPRADQVLSGKDPGPPLVSASDLFTSPPIALTQSEIGQHKLAFGAEVLYDARGLSKLAQLMGQALGAGGRKPDRKLAAQLAAGLHGAPSLGVLPPQGVQIPHGGDPVAWLDVPLQRVAQAKPQPVLVAALERGRSDVGGAVELGGALNAARSMPAHKPPAYVDAPPRAFQVTGAQSGEACIFHFPVKDGGEFILGGLQSGGKPNVTHQGNLWSGSGRLIVPLAGGSTSAYVRVSFKNWTLADDGTTVASGSFDVANPFEPRQIGGVEAKVLRLQGKAGDSVRMTVRATLKNPNILATAGQKPPPPLEATEELTPKGDWYAKGLSMPELGVYDSGFNLAPKSVALDLSASEGGACGGGSGWMGVSFAKDSQLQAYTFDLNKTESGGVTGWGIDAEGLCGTKNFGAYDSPVERGTIHWDSIEASAGGGSFSANYKGVRVHVPWLDADLTGNSQALHAGKGSGGGGIQLKLTNANAPAHTYGPVTMKAETLSFTTLKGASWAVHAARTSFSFMADGKQFAGNVMVPDLYFGMDGKAYFSGEGGSAQVSLSGAKGRLSQGVVDLKSMDVVATPNAASRLLFNFSTELRISDALPAAPAPVSYEIDQRSPTQYAGSGPVTGSFEIHKPFPDANPSTDSVIHPDYTGPKDGQSASADAGGWLIPSAHAASASHMSFCGDVDLGMFSGPPVKGGFALGYQGSDDFWAARADVGLGQTGTPLVPPYMTLYLVGGGLGYNITLDSFASGKSCDVKANIDHTPIFNAHLQVGDPSHFAYGFDGELSVKVSGPQAGARMDYKAWLARNSWDGAGDFHGYFQYANGNFDGTLNGHYAFLDNQVYIEAAHDAIAMHFGGGRWYVHAGTEPNPVRGHVLIVDAAAWLGLGNEGFYAGAKAHLNQGAGNCGDICARVSSDTEMEAKLTPQPHISADAHTHLDAHACAFDICLGAGLGGSMHAAAMPPELRFAFNLGGCPPGHLDVGLQILPSPKPHVGGGLCVW